MSKGKVYEYGGDAVTVRWDKRRCIHAAECVRGLPAVFDPDRRPWIDPAAAGADEVAAVVRRCPTGALSLERHDGGPEEPAAPLNHGTVADDGPLYLRGRIALRTADGETIADELRVALCRCGASQHKPYCDGSHAGAGFSAAGAAAAPRVAEGEPGDGVLTVTVTADGPLVLSGPLELRGAAGEDAFRGDKAALCRCGASGDKPFCDGSHGRVEFRG